MKTRTVVSILILVFTVLIVAGSCATEKKMVKKSEELLGTWINEEYADDWGYTTLIYKSDGVYEQYTDASLKERHQHGTYTITDKWTDSEGNIWYKATCKLTEGTQLITGCLLMMIINSENIHEENYNIEENILLK